MTVLYLLHLLNLLHAVKSYPVFLGENFQRRENIMSPILDIQVRLGFQRTEMISDKGMRQVLIKWDI